VHGIAELAPFAHQVGDRAQHAEDEGAQMSPVLAECPNLNRIG
jgi:hypothetical protein